MRGRVEAIIVLLAALAVREIWAVALPLDGGNDEIFHLHTARLVAALGRLPALGHDPGAAAFYHPVYGFNEMPYLTDPPGAYVAAAALLRLLPPGIPATLWLRQLPVMGGALAALLAYLALRRLWPSPSPVPLAAAALFALGPQFVFVTSYFSDEWLALLAAGIVYYAAARLLAEGLRPRAIAWAIAGLSLLAVSRLTYWPAGLVAIIAAATRWKEAPRGARVAALMLLLVPAVAAGSWILRNERLYRAWDGGPAAAAAVQHPAGFLPGFHAVVPRDHVPAKHPYLYQVGLGYLLRGTFMSFWGVFGYMGLLMPAAYYALWAALCAIALLGPAIENAKARKKEGRAEMLMRQQKEPGDLPDPRPISTDQNERSSHSLRVFFLSRFRVPSPDPQRRTPPPTPTAQVTGQRLFLAAGIVVFALALMAHLYFNLLAPVSARANFQPQGRYLFSALVPLLALLALGLDRLLAGRERWLVPLCALVAGASNAWALWIIHTGPWARLIWVR
jgi:hypothetical protein